MREELRSRWVSPPRARAPAKGVRRAKAANGLVQVGFAVPAALVRRLRRHCDRLSLPRATLVRALIERAAWREETGG